MPSNKRFADPDPSDHYDLTDAIASPFARRHAEANGTARWPRNDEQVVLGARVSVRRQKPAGAVVAVRLPRDLLARISEYATARGQSVTNVILEGAEQLLGRR